MNQPQTTDIAAEVAEFERKLERLRITYEQYFMGIEKREPSVQLKDVVRVMRRLDNEKIQNTALRYRLRTLVQKFNTYRNYWNRTLRAIEAGTYHRDVARVRRKMKRKGIDMPELGKLKRSGDIERALAEAAEKERKQDRDRDAPTRSASEIRGRPAEELPSTPQRALDGGAEDAWDQAVDSWEPNFGDDSDTDPGTQSPFAGQPTGPQLAPPAGAGAMAPPPPPPEAFAPPPIPQDALGGLEELASQSNVGQAPQDDRAPRPQRPMSRPRPTPPPQRGAAQRAAAPAGGPSGLPKEQMDSIYRRYVRAKKMCGEDPGSVRYDSLVKTIQRQLPKIQSMHAGREIDFQVVIRNGRAILKAKPK